MKQIYDRVFISGATAAVLLVSQPAWGQTAEVTDVQLNPVAGGININLKTNSGSRPAVFTTKRGRTLVSDIINTQLRLPQGNSYHQDNPSPGIASIDIIKLDANSIRVVVTGNNEAPSNQPVIRNPGLLTLGFSSTADSTASATTPTTPTTPTNITPTQTSQKPEVLVPNPKITIDGTPAQPSGAGQPYNQAPPFLPRAVAPPVGDIATASTDTSPNNIDLGTQERVPRLVLRDAPAREVLLLLARAAGVNLVYLGSEGASQQPGEGGQQAAGKDERVISLDIENEPVQDVFNYVLRLSNLEASRSGRTVFVGTKLPNSTRDLVMRSLRLNQVTAGVALNFLVGLGAESAISRERLVTSVSAVPVGNSVAAPITQTQTTTETRVETQRIDYKDSAPLLRGLAALGDERTNSVTLVGSPRLVDIAISQLTKLDLRRRQVVVNVKIIDVNLTNTKDFNTSFSFGVGKNYFTSDGGAATFNFGGSRPATNTEVASSVTSTPTITNPITGTPFLNANGTFTVPNSGSGVRVIQDGQLILDQPGSSTFLQPIPPINSNPTQPGLSGFTPGTPDTFTTTTDPTTGRQTTVFAAGTRPTAQYSLPTLYQFPQRFLASLQSQVTSGNAKILTDPTLIVQEGQTANVALTQEVVGNFKNDITTANNTTTQTVTVEKTNVGLTLAVKVDRIDDNGFVSLSVSPTVRAPQSSQNITLGNSGSQTIFLVSDRSLNSGLIRLRDGQTLILSGIIQDQDTTTVSKLPILGDIPLIGSLFRKTNKQNQRKEVIVLLTPQIMDDTQNSAYGYNYTPSPDVRQVLERSGLKFPKRQ